MRTVYQFRDYKIDYDFHNHTYIVSKNKTVIAVVNTKEDAYAILDEYVTTE